MPTGTTVRPAAAPKFQPPRNLRQAGQRWHRVRRHRYRHRTKPCQPLCCIAWVLAFSCPLLADPPTLSPNSLPAPDLNVSLLQWQRGQLARDQALRMQIDSLQNLRVYQQQVRSQWRQMLGPWPRRTPLNARCTGRLQRDSYTVEKILLESQPGFFVTVNLYLPRNRTGKLPVVLSPIGHAPLGKAHHTNDNYQARFITLAKSGYVVCVWDPLGQGEREPYGQRTGNHHTVQGYQCMPSARHFCLYFLWDGIRCLDYLETRPEIDRSRIACAGCSGGGALTQYLAALDDRITLAVPTSWIAESTHLTLDRGLHTESWFPGMCDPYGPGTAQLLACIAPRPLLILGNDHDAEFPADSMSRVAEETAALYSRLGLAHRLRYVSVDSPHGFWPPARAHLYRFLERHLDGPRVPDPEPPVRTETAADLFCAPGGQVRNLPGSKTVFDLNREALQQLARQRSTRRKQLSSVDYFDIIRNGVLQSARLAAHSFSRPGWQPQLQVRIPPPADYAEGCCAYLPGFSTPVRLYRNLSSRHLAVVIADNLSVGHARSSGLAEAGLNVLWLVADQTDDRREIMSGSPRTGRWALMFRHAATAVQALPEFKGISLVAVGEGLNAARAAQFAAISEPGRYRAVIALRGLTDLPSLGHGVAQFHSYQMQPGALRWFDADDLAAALAPLPQWIGDTRDARLQILDQKTLSDRYRWTTTRYRSRSGPLHLAAGTTGSPQLARWLKQHVPAHHNELQPAVDSP
ncbi:MAG: acetylxylan esterase [Planctomycetota bacterium]|nr:acetylxylan esterase [Planctomycetota bacterium]